MFPTSHEPPDPSSAFTREHDPIGELAERLKQRDDENVRVIVACLKRMTLHEHKIVANGFLKAMAKQDNALDQSPYNVIDGLHTFAVNYGVETNENEPTTTAGTGGRGLPESDNGNGEGNVSPIRSSGEEGSAPRVVTEGRDRSRRRPQSGDNAAAPS